MAFVADRQRIPRLERAHFAEPSVRSPSVRVRLTLSVCEKVTVELLALQSADSAVGDVELLSALASVLA